MKIKALKITFWAVTIVTIAYIITGLLYYFSVIEIDTKIINFCTIMSIPIAFWSVSFSLYCTIGSEKREKELDEKLNIFSKQTEELKQQIIELSNQVNQLSQKRTFTDRLVDWLTKKG